MSIRNFFFDFGILKSYSFTLPIISVGNLSVGGTGKTPQIEYLIRLLYPNHKIATLSRGYKRITKGFVLANERSNALELGDEPFQFYQKFKTIQVAVDANRKNGIEQLCTTVNPPEIILLDDAFQHRKVKAGYSIVLTSYGDLYCNDWILPAGNLRESRTGAKRANSIIVTKCPPTLSVKDQTILKKALTLSPHQRVFFTCIEYDDLIYSNKKTVKVADIKNQSKLLLAGIAKPKSFFDHLKQDQDECLIFPDHHLFSESELLKIKQKAGTQIIVTTEKDYMRLKGSILSKQLYYLPIKNRFLCDGDLFNNEIAQYINSFATSL